MSKVTKTAIRLAGGASAVAAYLGISRQAVSKWERVPVKHVLAVEKITGISRYTLRADIYGKAP